MKKGLISEIFAILGLMVFKKLLFDTQKMLSGSWNFFWASPTVPSRNFSPRFICPSILWQCPQLKDDFWDHFFQKFFLWTQFLVLIVLSYLDKILHGNSACGMFNNSSFINLIQLSKWKWNLKKICKNHGHLYSVRFHFIHIMLSQTCFFFHLTTVIIGSFCISPYIYIYIYVYLAA